MLFIFMIEVHNTVTKGNTMHTCSSHGSSKVSLRKLRLNNNMVRGRESGALRPLTNMREDHYRKMCYFRELQLFAFFADRP